MKKPIWLSVLALLACSFGAHAQCPSQTANLGLQVPNLGNTTTWGLCINEDLNALDAVIAGSGTLATGTTPTLPAVNVNSTFVTANIAPTAITSINGAFPGEVLKLVCGASDTFTSIAPSMTMVLNGTWACPSGHTITLLFIGATWYELSRASSLPDFQRERAALCNNATASTLWSLPTSSAPTVACRTGSNVQAGVLQFAANNSAQFTLDIPNDWDSATPVYAKIYFTQAANTTSGQTIIMQIATACPGTTDDTAFNAAQAFATATTTTTAHTPFTETLSSVTMTGCSAGKSLSVKISRSGSDTATTSPNVYWVSVTFARQPTIQAN